MVQKKIQPYVPPLPIIGIPGTGFPGMPGGILPGGRPLPDLFLPCDAWNLGGPGAVGRDLVDCFCFTASLVDMVPLPGIGNDPYVEAADCVCNVLIAIQVACNRNDAWGVAYGVLAGIDCSSLPLGGAAGVVLGCLTGGAIGTPPAPGAGTGVGCIVGGLAGGAASSWIGDFLIDVPAWAFQAWISCGGVEGAWNTGVNACRQTRATSLADK